MPKKRSEYDRIRYAHSERSEPFRRIYEIPVATKSENNLREHWAKKAKRVQEQRWSARVVTRSKIGSEEIGEFLSGKFRVTLTRLSPRELDSDNLAGAFKAVRDGIADAFGVNDRDARIEWAYAQRKEVNKKTEVLIEEVFG